jgi:integration host factor subunit alpha
VKIPIQPQGAHPMTLTKANLIDSLYNESDLQKQKSRIIVESLLEIIKHKLESGEDVLISGFGKFCVKDKKERKGRNPQTASDMKLRARRVVTFKCSGVLRENLNKKKRRRKS